MGLNTPTKNLGKKLLQCTENTETLNICCVNLICIISHQRCSVNEQRMLCEVLTVIHCNDVSLALIRSEAMHNFP